jgi:hypothetical protein
VASALDGCHGASFYLHLRGAPVLPLLILQDMLRTLSAMRMICVCEHACMFAVSWPVRGILSA